MAKRVRRTAVADFKRELFMKAGFCFTTLVISAAFLSGTAISLMAN